jgi:CubicO group peptidase (beta-lactamase class C family)
MASTGFDRPTALAQAFARSDDGFRPVAMTPPLEPEFYGMGHALYGTVPDYLRFLRMLLGGGLLDGVRVLSAVTVDRLLADHTGGLTIAPMITTTPAVTESVDLFPGLALSHSLLALRVEADVPGRRSAGSQGWAGILNAHFWLDPVRDRAGVFATQLLPFADRRFLEAYAGFERAVYD